MKNITYKLKVNSEQILYLPSFDELIETIKDISSKQKKGYVFVYQKINDNEWKYICNVNFKKSKYNIVPAWIGVLEDIAERLDSKQEMNFKVNNGTDKRVIKFLKKYENNPKDCQAEFDKLKGKAQELFDEVMKTDKKEQTSIKDNTIQLWQEYKEKGEIFNFIAKFQNEIDFVKGLLANDYGLESSVAILEARKTISHISEGICEATICDYDKIHNLIKDIDTVSDCDDLSIVREKLLKIRGKLFDIEKNVEKYKDLQ